MHYENNPNSPTDEKDLLGKFARIEWLLHRYHLKNHLHHGPMGDPHRGQGRILALLKLQPEISQKDLAYLLDIRPQSLGELLAKLEKGGYIERMPAEEDRRVMRIKLTPEGEKAAGQPTDSHEIFDSLSMEEKERLCGLLDRVIQAMEQNWGNESDEEFRRERGREGFPFERETFDPRGGGRRGPHGRFADMRRELMRSYREGCREMERGRPWPEKAEPGIEN